MAKYIIALTVLAVLAFENGSLHKRFCVESLPSVRGEATDGSQAQNRAHLINKLYASHHHHRHKRTHHNQQQHQEQQKHQSHQNQHQQKKAQKVVVKRQSDLESSIERDREIDAEFLRRHQERQLEHLLHHREHYNQQQQQKLQQQQQPLITSSEELDENLKTMPRPWQHLSQPYDKMFADAPFELLPDDENFNDSNDYSVDDAFLAGMSLDSAPEDEGFVDAESTSQALNSIHNENLASVEIPVEADSAAASSMESSNGQRSTHRCPKCESQRQVEHITEEELTRLRIEFVKTQILEKLRLKERPNVSAVSLPKPIQEGVTIDQGDEQSKNKELDDYYARTSKKFIFLERETRNCKSTSVQKSICFSFKIDDADADGFDVNTAALWIFKKSLKNKRKLQATTPQTNNTTNSQNNNNNTLINHEDIVVYEVQPPDDQDFLPVSKTIAIKRIDKNVSDKWLQIHIEWPIQRWFGNHDLSHLIQISCESCDISDIEDMISLDKDYRPFIIIDTQNRRRTSRQKRSINCTDGVTECCREKLYISFEEIGWGDWIIQPRGYDAYFCRGSCGTVASVTQSSSHHSTFLQKVIAMNRGNGRKPLELIPCCTAKQYSSLQLVFMDSNNTATQKTFPNMVIESCGCR